MIIGELDLERAERDPGYLARVKAFLLSGAQTGAAPVSRLAEPPARAMPPNVMDGTASELGLN
ncbi:MAG: hypothetical protein QGF20_11665 [Alphaproteobacteria bacterium]|nr:hypothetical protein [Alphaproteobacteria bacterium]